MVLQDFLGLVRGVKGPNGSGEYSAKCPAHDDRQASLCFKAGDKGIVLKCQAGCSCAAVCSALGIAQADLFFEAPRRGKTRASRKNIAAKVPSAEPSEEASPVPGMKVHTAKHFDSYSAAYGHMGTVERVYTYQDGTGKTLFEVARIRRADGGKTFRQHRPVNPDGGPFPFVCNVPAEVRNRALYRLPEVLAAIQAGQPVYVVEGEKDADTIAGFGYCGTTNAGGAGKWTKAQSALLAGADVVIIPDEDPESNGQAGQKHGEAVAASLAGVAKRVRLVRLKDAYPDLPEKGDISDLAALVGADRARGMLDALVKACAPLEQTPLSQALAAYSQVPGYCADADGVYSVLADGSNRRLSTFVALPVRETLRDDGSQRELWLDIAGWAAGGKPLATYSVPVSKFPAMDWPLTAWGMGANILPGRQVRDQLRFAIQSVGALTASRAVLYTHTGWRKILGKWCYLYQGGSVGGTGVSVDLGAGLAAYALAPCPDGMALSDAVATSLQLAAIIAQPVSVPLLGAGSLAPLQEFLQRAGCEPAFAIFLSGGRGTRKSTAAALFLSHFGEFTAQSLPASFNDTANYIRRKAFVVKDSLLVVDDYHPVSSLQERRAMERIAQGLTRAFGDRAERGRLDVDLSIQPSWPPRCLAVITGEEVPDVGESGVNRFYVVTVGANDVPICEDLTELQRIARAGALRLAMRGYLEWLAPQADALPDMLAEMFSCYRDRARSILGTNSTHPRAVDAVAFLMIGLTMLNRYCAALGVYSPELAAAMTEELWPIVAQNAAVQALANREESPSRMFVSALRELLSSGEATVIALDGVSALEKPSPGMIGYCDTENYYLLGDTALGMVATFYRAQDRAFPVKQRALYSALAADGILVSAMDGRSARLKWINGKALRLLWVPRVHLDGKPPQKPIQTQMDFQPVPPSEIPASF